jgi:hypothetical protein
VLKARLLKITSKTMFDEYIGETRCKIVIFIIEWNELIEDVWKFIVKHLIYVLTCSFAVF